MANRFKQILKAFWNFCKNTISNKKSVAVSINLEIIKQDKWNTYELKNGDVIECLTFMGGG